MGITEKVLIITILDIIGIFNLIYANDNIKEGKRTRGVMDIVFGFLLICVSGLLAFTF